MTPGRHLLTLGVFDGVHLGHRALLARVSAEASARGLGAGVVTFHPNPITVLRPDVPFSYLTTLEQRVELLREAGADWVAVAQFTSELALVSAKDFCRMLVEDAGMAVLVVGENFRLGRGRAGDVPRLRAIGEVQGFEVLTVPLTGGEGDEISSTRIRGALAAGEMAGVTSLLGRPYSLRGPVLHGDERGRTIGFPTLNIGASADQALPPNGVYVTTVEVLGRRHDSLTNIGTQPTFEGTRRRIETHVLDFAANAYDQVVRIELLHRLRAEQRFDGAEALVRQIEQDVAATRAYFSDPRVLAARP